MATRFLLADLVKFPSHIIGAEMPEAFGATSLLARKAGCPFEWAFLLFLPVLGAACSKARLHTKAVGFKNRRVLERETDNDEEPSNDLYIAYLTIMRQYG